MNKLIFKANFGDEIKDVELSAPSGGAGDYFLMIDKYYRGTLMKRGGIWEGFFNTPNDFTGADIYEMGAMIDATTNDRN